MAIYDIIPNDVQLADVRDTLNYNGGVAGNTLDSLITKAANIDVWSKKKPVIFNNPFPNINSEWWKANDGNCGLEIKRINDYTELPTLYNGFTDDLNGWVYQLPLGGANEPFRLGDFAGYNPKAYPPFSNFTVPNQVSKKESTFLITFNVVASGEHQLSLSDFTLLKDCYLGAYIKNDVTSSFQRATSNSVNATDITFSTNGFNVGKYTVYPFLSSIRINQTDEDFVASFFTVPNIKPIKIEFVDSVLQILINAIRETDGTISYRVEIYNTTDNSYTITNNNVALRYSYKDWQDEFEINEQIISLDNVTARPGTTVVGEGYFTGVPQDLYNDCLVWASLNNGEYLTSVTPYLA